MPSEAVETVVFAVSPVIVAINAVIGAIILAKNSEPDENLPDTDPAPEVPAPEEIRVVGEVKEDSDSDRENECESD